MSDNKKLHLAVWTAWLVLHGYLLCFRFSLSGLAVLALGAGILLLTTYYSSKYEEAFLVHTLGNVIGAALFVQLGWYFVENILPGIVIEENWVASFGEVVFRKLQWLMMWTINNGTMTIPSIVAAALYILRLCTGKRPRLSMLASYAGNAALMIPLLMKIYRTPTVTVLYLAVSLVFVWADLWHIAVEDEWNKSCKRWANALSLLLLFVLSWSPFMLQPLLAEGALESIFVLGATKWHHLLVAGVVLAGLFAAYVAVVPVEGEQLVNYKLLTAGASMLLLTAFLKWFHVGWWWLLVLVNVIGLLADAWFVYPALDEDEDAVLGSWGIQIGAAVVSILIAVTGHFGTWPMLLALVAGAVVLFFGVMLSLDQENEDLHLPGIVLATVLAVLVPVLVWLWMYRRLEYSFGLVLILAAVCLTAAALLCWNVTQKDRQNRLAPIAAAAVFVILALNLTMTGGSRIDMELDDTGRPVVTAQARGKDNRVVSTEYRWTEDWLDVDSWKLESHEETELSNLTQLRNREGKLRVIVTDQYGIITESIFWIHHVPQPENG